MASIQQVKCAACDVPLKGPGDAKPQDMFACPQCGQSDSVDNIFGEIREYAAAEAAELLVTKIEEVARSSKFLKATIHSREKKAHRFVIDLGLHP